MYDSKKGRYVSTNLDNGGGWSAGYYTLSGNTEHWTDSAADTGKLGRSTTVRTNDNTFTSVGYPTMTSTKVNFKATCRRSS